MYFGTLLLLLFQAVQNPASAIPADQPKAVLRGHVYALDSGAPLKRAQVILNGRASVTISTDAQGAFEFREVMPGNYSINCSRLGFVSAQYGQRDRNRSGALITVSPGQELKDLDCRLARTAVISGTVTDDEGEPVRNVQVSAMDRSYRRGQIQLWPRGSANTDDRGQYRIFDLPPGRYYVQAIHRGAWYPGGENVGLLAVYFPNAFKLEDAQRLEVTNGAEVSRIDLAMRQSPTYSVSGRVFDAAGRPAASGNVSVGVSIGSMSWSAGGQGIRPDGSFTVRGLTPGSYLLMFTFPDRYGEMNRDSVRYTKVIEVGDSNITSLTVNVGPGATVRGRITVDGGNLPSNLRVNLISKAGFMAGSASPPVGKDLTFEIANVQPGDYDVAFLQDYSRIFYVREVRQANQGTPDRVLTIVEGSPVEVELVLDFKPGVVSGRASDEEGNPLEGASVVLLSADPKLRAQDRYFRTGTSGPNGAFTVPGVIPGEYLAVLWPGQDPYQVQDPDVFKVLETHATRITVEKGVPAKQDLKLAAEGKALAQSISQ